MPEPSTWLHQLRTEAWVRHDAFNLVMLPIAVALTVAGLVSRTPSAGTALARFMAGYIAADSVWLVLQPSVVGAPLVLLFHHAVTLLLLAHSLTHAPHLRYVAWMTVVEVNTFFLILRRHWRARAVEALHIVTWLAIRVLWFPYLPFHWFWLIAEPWPAGPTGQARRLLVSGATVLLAVLQLFWTRKAVGSLLGRRASEGRGAAASTKRGTRQWL